MNEETIVVALPIILAVIAAIPGVAAYANERRRIRKEREDTALDAWQELLDPLRERNATLQSYIREMDPMLDSQRDRIKALEDHNTVLVRQLDSAQRLVTAYLAQLVDAGIAPNALYIEQTRGDNDPTHSE